MKGIVTWTVAVLICIGIGVVANRVGQVEQNNKEAETYEIDELFTHKGITVYRFYDHGYNNHVYFANDNNTVWSKNQSVVKTNSTTPKEND